MLYLDYGGFTDSAGKKISVWSATILAKGRQQVHVDFFVDAANQVSNRPGAKKSGKTGIYFLRELFDSPDGAGSLFSRVYPAVTHLLLSGDTGNGYRAYEMLEELSCMFSKFKYTCELIPLPPGHAWNRTDARIAHQNVFLRNLKAKSRVYGAKEVANAFHLASDARHARRRKYLARSHIFFRVVVHQPRLDNNAQLGAQLVRADLDKGHMGVRGFLYFNFSFIGPNGDLIHPQGAARVREYGTEEMVGNPTAVYTWRKDLAIHICQTCSDAVVRNCH